MAVKQYWRLRKQIILHRGVLYYRWEEVDGGHRLLLMTPDDPQSMCKEALKLAYDCPMAGHSVRDKTIHRVGRYFLWHGMNIDVEQYVGTCSICSAQKKPRGT